MVTLHLTDDKRLIVVANSANYEGENAFEAVTVKSSETVSGHALKDCIIECHIINPNGEGDIIELAFLDDTASFLLSNRYTAVNGDLVLFLKLFCGGDVIGLTNEVIVKIKAHRAVTSYILDGQLTLLDQYSQTFHRAENIISDGLDEAVGESVETYLSTHEVGEELTDEDIEPIFEEE